MKDAITTALATLILNLLAIVIGAFITGLIVMLVWNWLMPAIFDIRTITYLQGWGISFLCGLLFRSATTTTVSKD